MPPRQRRGGAAKNRASRRTLRSRVVASPVVSEAASPASPPAREVSPDVSSEAGSPVASPARELSPLPYTPTSPAVGTPTPTVEAIPSILGRKRPASEAVSVTVALAALLMRF